MFSKNRIEALSDGVFAIAMTLLVLDLKVEPGVPADMLWHTIRHGGHAWFSFLITFAIASVFWTLQHRLFDRIERISHQTLVPTFVFLGLVSILPFTTHVLGLYITAPLALMLYFGNALAIAVALTVKLELARHHGHLLPGVETDTLRLRLYTMCGAMAAGLIGARFLRLEFVGIAPVLIGITSKRIRAAKLARMEVPAD